jgi:hypothetical protein
VIQNFWKLGEEKIMIEKKVKKGKVFVYTLTTDLIKEDAVIFIDLYEKRRKQYVDNREGTSTFTKSFFVREIILDWISRQTVKPVSQPESVEEPKQETSLESAITKVISKLLLR